MKRSKTLFWFLTLLHGAVVILVSKSESRTKEVPKGPNSVCFYRFWRRLFRKEVGDDDHGVAGRGPDVQDTDFAPGLVAGCVFVKKKKATVEVVVNWLYSCA